MKNNIIKLSATSFVFFLMVSPLLVSAQIENPLKFSTSISSFVSSVLDYAVQIISVGAVLGFIYSGFLFIKAQGNPGEITKAQEVFYNVCLGTVILLGANLIAKIIVGTLNKL